MIQLPISLQYIKCFFPWCRIRAFVSVNCHTAACNTRKPNFIYALNKTKRSPDWFSRKSETSCCTVFRHAQWRSVRCGNKRGNLLRPRRTDGRTDFVASSFMKLTYSANIFWMYFCTELYRNRKKNWWNTVCIALTLVRKERPSLQQTLRNFVVTFYT